MIGCCIANLFALLVRFTLFRWHAYLYLYHLVKLFELVLLVYFSDHGVLTSVVTANDHLIAHGFVIVWNGRGHYEPA